jgi:V-type H+-transporting ATPase subunit d
MIDNVLLAIVGTKHGHKMEQLRGHFHPLGLFDQLESVPAASSPDEAFKCILADTPLGRRSLACCLQSRLVNTPPSPSADYYDECHAELDLSEKSIEVLRNSLHKAYIEDFTRLCADIGGGTEEVMSEILAVSPPYPSPSPRHLLRRDQGFVQFEADRRSIVLTVNSFGTGRTKTERRALFPQCGRLAPYGLQVLAEADDVDGVMQLSFLYPQYDALLERDAETGRLNEEAFNRHEVCPSTCHDGLHRSPALTCTHPPIRL